MKHTHNLRYKSSVPYMWAAVLLTTPPALVLGSHVSFIWMQRFISSDVATYKHFKLLKTNLLYKSPNAGEIKLLKLCVAKQKERPLRAAEEMSAWKHTHTHTHTHARFFKCRRQRKLDIGACASFPRQEYIHTRTRKQVKKVVSEREMRWRRERREKKFVMSWTVIQTTFCCCSLRQAKVFVPEKLTCVN